MRFLIVLTFLLNVLNLWSQDKKDSIPAPTHSVKKAMILSAVVPGSGQIYNHRAMPKGQKKAFWKVPLIYAGLGATGYFLINNQLTQKALKAEYNNRMNGNATDPQWEIYDDPGILTLYNQYLDRRDLSILGFAAVYAFQIADAGIEAHFVRFDISKDLSLQIRPSILNSRQAGISASFNFR
jgi:hypothetical protein